jgi:hypothetical protein
MWKLERDCAYSDSDRDYLVSRALEIECQASNVQPVPGGSTGGEERKEDRVRRIAERREFGAAVLCSAVGVTLFYQLSFPSENPLLKPIFLHANCSTGSSIAYPITLSTSPYIGLSVLFSLVCHSCLDQPNFLDSIAPWKRSRKMRSWSPIPASTRHWSAIACRQYAGRFALVSSRIS